MFKRIPRGTPDHRIVRNDDPPDYYDDAPDPIEGYCALCGGFVEGIPDGEGAYSPCCDADILDDPPEGYDEEKGLTSGA